MPLDFLPAGEYSVTITEDGPDADYLTNRETASEKTFTLDVTDNAPSIQMHLAPGGGACVLIDRLR